MGRFRKRPSPALLVAIIALVFAVAGTSVAAINSLSKKQKSQTRKIAQSEIAKAAPGLSVANAGHANQADAVKAGSIGPSELSGTIPAAHVTSTAAQTVSDNTEEPVEFDSERYDTAAMHDDATDNTRVTAPVAGIYNITAQIDWEAGTSAGRELSLRKNGVTTIAFARTETSETQQTVTTQVRLAAGDFVEAWVFQESGGELDIDKLSEFSPELSMTWLAHGP